MQKNRRLWGLVKNGVEAFMSNLLIPVSMESTGLHFHLYIPLRWIFSQHLSISATKIIIALTLSSSTTAKQLNDYMLFPNHILCYSVFALPFAWNRAIFPALAQMPSLPWSLPILSLTGWISPFFWPLSFYIFLFCGFSFSSASQYSCLNTWHVLPSALPAP